MDVLGLFPNEDGSSRSRIFDTMVIPNLFTVEKNFEKIGQLFGQFLTIYIGARLRRGNPWEEKTKNPKNP